MWRNAKMYKLCIQNNKAIHTLLPGGKSHWFSKGRVHKV